MRVRNEAGGNRVLGKHVMDWCFEGSECRFITEQTREEVEDSRWLMHVVMKHERFHDLYHSFLAHLQNRFPLLMQPNSNPHSMHHTLLMPPPNLVPPNQSSRNSNNTNQRHIANAQSNASSPIYSIDVEVGLPAFTTFWSPTRLSRDPIDVEPAAGLEESVPSRTTSRIVPV